MDISTLSTKKVSEEGKWVKVELYGKFAGFWLKILGADSDRVKEFEKDQFRKMTANAGTGKKIDDDTLEEVLNSDTESAINRLCGIAGGDENKLDEKDPVILFDRTLGNDEGSFRYLLEEVPALKKFVINYSKERTNFLFQKKED